MKGVGSGRNELFVLPHSWFSIHGISFTCTDTNASCR